MRKSTAKYENYPVRRTGFFVWAALIFVWGVPASAQEPVRMQVKDSCGVQTEPYEAATYPGGIVAFREWVTGRVAGHIVEAAYAEYRKSRRTPGVVPGWDAERLMADERREAVRNWCERHLAPEEYVTVSFTVTAQGSVEEVRILRTPDEALGGIVQRTLAKSAPWIAARRSVDGQSRAEPARLRFRIAPNSCGNDSI